MVFYQGRFWTKRGDVLAGFLDPEDALLYKQTGRISPNAILYYSPRH